MLIIRSVVFIIFCSLVSAFVVAAPAPSFTLPTAHDSVAFDSLRGKVVLVDFWASWCDPCRKSFPWLEDMYLKYSKQGLTIVAINLDAKRDNADKFLAKFPSDFTIAFDPKATVAQLYDVKAMPSSFLIDRTGNIILTHTGFQEEQADELESHVQEALKK